jgi:hypothetical protein
MVIIVDVILNLLYFPSLLFFFFFLLALAELVDLPGDDDGCLGELCGAGELCDTETSCTSSPSFLFRFASAKNVCF